MKSAVLVDDEIDLVESIQEVLETEDIKIVATGNNGQEAVELCIKHLPDFLILDLGMPKFDGIHALEKLSEKNSSVKVIIMTGLLDEEHKANLKRFKIDASFIKPTSPIAIADFIKNN